MSAVDRCIIVGVASMIGIAASSRVTGGGNMDRYVAYMLMCMCSVVFLAIGMMLRGAIDAERAKRARAKAEERHFAVLCPVCEHKMMCEKGSVRKRLEDEKPYIQCAQCNASLIAPYMDHPFVKRARAEFATLIEYNKTMRAVLEEPHHPIKQEEEDAIKELKAKEEKTKAGTAMVVYPRQVGGDYDK